MKADPVAVAAVLGCLNQPFDLCLGQVLRVCRSLLGAARVQVGIAQIHIFAKRNHYEFAADVPLNSRSLISTLSMRSGLRSRWTS